MEETIELKSWAEFEAEVSKHEAKSNGSPILYRGQSDAKWPLFSTLEREGNWDISLSEYYRRILSINPEIETFTGQHWNIPKLKEYSKWAKKYDAVSSATTSPFLAYDYFVYLRHHGYPSPLLDWSSSPYIAAFFAFEKVRVREGARVAIFSYQENMGNGKSTSSNNPQLHSLGANIKAPKRHFFQKSQYTISAQFKGPNEAIRNSDKPSQNQEWSYTRHQDVFELDQKEQDILRKFILPGSAKNEVLKMFDRFNLNAFSLFQDEESLLRSLAFRQS